MGDYTNDESDRLWNLRGRSPIIFVSIPLTLTSISSLALLNEAIKPGFRLLQGWKVEISSWFPQERKAFFFNLSFTPRQNKGFGLITLFF